MKVKKKFFYTLFIVIIFCSLAELFSYVILKFKYNIVNTKSTLQNNFQYNFEEFNKKQFKFQSIIINGYRYNSHFDFTKSNDGKDIILFMGDSCTEGWVNSKNKFPLMFEYILNSNMPENNFKIINCGVGGTTSTQGLTQLKENFLKYKPKVIFWFYVWNDMWEGEDPSIIINGSITNFFKKFFIDLENINSYVLLRKLLNPPKIDFEKLNTPPDKFINNLNELNLICRNNNIKLVLITAPSDIKKSSLNKKELNGNLTDEIYPLSGMLERYNNIIRDFALEKNIEFVDLYSELRNYKEYRIFFINDHIHFTWLGNHKIAEIFFEKIKNNL